jgi:hypothetical protein
VDGGERDVLERRDLERKEERGKPDGNYEL